jgi:hypothetical protein
MAAYEDVKNYFIQNKCKLLNTEEEYIEIKNSMKHPKYNYIASCGHAHSVFFNVFKNRKTGVMCPKCIVERNKEASKIRISNDKLQFIKMEFSGIEYVNPFIHSEFSVIKAFDGCKADIIIKPKKIETDEWIGVQIKTTSSSANGYGFHLEQNYENYIILCICEMDNRIWCIPYNDINNVVKLSIGCEKSKYSKYEVTKENIISVLHNFYNQTKKYTFEELDTPINVFQKREKEYRKYREAKINFIDFEYEGMEGTVYDFLIDTIKVQEKVGCFLKEDDRILFELCKKNGLKNNVQYDKGDNDLYWLNCNNKKDFYVIPESILIEKGYVGNKTNPNKIHFKLPKLDNQIKNIDYWTNKYLFDYEKVNKEKLLNIIYQMAIP